jgi:hypothetical protein
MSFTLENIVDFVAPGYGKLAVARWEDKKRAEANAERDRTRT